MSRNNQEPSFEPNWNLHFLHEVGGRCSDGSIFLWCFCRCGAGKYFTSTFAPLNWTELMPGGINLERWWWCYSSGQLEAIRMTVPVLCSPLLKVTVSNAASASQDVMPTVFPSQWFAETPSAGPKEAGIPTKKSTDSTDPTQLDP